MALSFLTYEDSYPFKSNMEQFADEYKFNVKDSYDDENKVTPKFCMFNGEKHVYLDNKMLDSMCKTRDDKKKLVEYIKNHFETGLDIKPEEVGTISHPRVKEDEEPLEPLAKKKKEVD